MMHRNVIGIIPARYASSRFPGKMLISLNGKSMIEHVYARARQALDQVYVATDDERIATAVQDFGGHVIMTSENHENGTSRCLEAVDHLIEKGEVIDVVINIQGDEPIIQPEQIDLLRACFDDASVSMATLVNEVRSPEELELDGEVFVVLDQNKNALYFSRSVIPFVRDADRSKWTNKHLFYKHVGLYGYTTDALRQYTSLAESRLEKAEKLEQNRWLEYGQKIRVAVSPYESYCIDTPDDVPRILEKMNNR